MAYTVVLEGGSPWGFRLEGGSEFSEPLRIAKVSPRKHFHFIDLENVPVSVLTVCQKLSLFEVM